MGNGLNERNQASADLTIKKLLEEKKTPLNDSLVKAAAWTHNTSINKLGYTALQLVTGKKVTLPGLTTGNKATESSTDSEAVQKTMELLAKTTSEFSEVGMRKKLNECQGLRTQAYQRMRDYVEGDKVWYQLLNGNSWFGPASVLCQRGQSVWIHTNRDIKKVAACKTKPYELLEMDLQNTAQNTQNTQSTQNTHSQHTTYQSSVTFSCHYTQGKKKKMVMLEEGLSDGEDKLDPEEETRTYAMKMIDAEKDNVGAQYLKL